MLSSEELSALYYPYPTPVSADKLKKAVLFFDHIHFIVPASKEAWFVIGIERGTADRFTELHRVLGGGVDADVFRIVRPADTVDEFSDSILQALEEDNIDQEFAKECQNQQDWLLYPEKLPEGLSRVFYSNELDKYRTGRTVKLPFAVGESIMISHAVYGCIYKHDKEHEFVTPLTDEPVHQRLLRRRLDRGIHNRETKTGAKVQKLGREGFDIALLPTPTGNIGDLIEKKRSSPSSVAKLRKTVKKLSELLLTRPRPVDFTSQYSDINDEIRGIYEEMGLVKLSQRMIMKMTNKKIVSVRGNGISMPVIGGWRSAIIGMIREPNIANAAITSKDTDFSRKLLADSSRLSTPDIAYELVTA